ncbi:hypothetical protein [Tunicatimonas pelagia]|uniref:hypothetical protein n=1 Tax=Tunicatimonas pelagia TaxID=931531 RepID=UPI002666BBC3|nr:hypothetical protein [Tunicatimonas pelagia]WKN41325.1 hypothetical protein P0M28_20015 [Tunicatimonas pelagia]
MITIYLNKTRQAEVAQIIDAVPRLSELITITTEDALVANLIVDERGIIMPLNWDNNAPPFLMSSPVAFSSETLLGYIFIALGNYAEAQNYLAKHPKLYNEVISLGCLQTNQPLPNELADTLDKEGCRSNHNIALLQQYGLWPLAVTLAEVQQMYQKALAIAPDNEHHAFTLKQYATLLLDTNQGAKAEELLQQHLSQDLSEEASYALKSVLISAWMARLSVPYDENRINSLKDLLWETLTYLERQERMAEVGLLLIDASEVANISESYSESLGYINRALDIFRAQDLPELAGSSLLRKGTLLYTWAQNGNPQFYKPAIDTYQEALKVFKRDEAPETFAQIHAHLGVLYAEMSDLQQKKGIWAAVSATSFQEALVFFTKEAHPYEYGLVCNNYANALTKYPTALRIDNYEKALEYYKEALAVRTSVYPYERSITLLNYLEASWFLDNGDDNFNQTRYQDMLNKAQEVKTLVDAPDLLTEADRHLEELARLEQEAKSEGYA